MDMATKPVSVTSNGNVKITSAVTDKRNGHRNRYLYRSLKKLHKIDDNRSYFNYK